MYFRPVTTKKWLDPEYSDLINGLVSVCIHNFVVLLRGSRNENVGLSEKKKVSGAVFEVYTLSPAPILLLSFPFVARWTALLFLCLLDLPVCPPVSKGVETADHGAVVLNLPPAAAL